METVQSKPRNRTKRRERAHQLNQEKQNLADEALSGDEPKGSPSRSSKEKCRAKARRQRNNSSHSFEEDFIDGFAIMSFKTLEDLENAVKNSSLKSSRPGSKLDHPASSPTSDRERVKDGRSKKKLRKQSTPSPVPSPRSLALLSAGEDDRTSTDEQTTNGPLEPPRSISRDRLSDASTHSSSGQGYVCDIESGDEKASESGSDLFTTVSNCASRLINHVRPVVALTPPATTATLCNGVVPMVTVNPTTTTASPALISSISISTTATTTTTTTSTTATPGTIAPTTLTVSSAASAILPSTLLPQTLPPSSSLPQTTGPKNIPTGAAIPIRRPTPSSPPPPKAIQASSSSSNNHHSNKPRPSPVSATPPVTLEGTKVPTPRTPRREDHHHHHHHHHHSSSSRERERDREREREKEREREREREAASSSSSSSSHHPAASFPGSLVFSKPGLWGSGPSPSLYSHSSHLPPSPLHSLHSTAFTHTHTHPLHPHHHPHAHPHPAVPHSSHGMFAPPIPPGPSALASSALSSVSASSFGSDLLRAEEVISVFPPPSLGQDFLHQDLNNRLLAHRGVETGPLPPSPFLRSVAAATDAAHHQHQHLHNHQHMHQHTYNGLGQPSLVPTPPPHLFDKIPKSPFESSLYRPNLLTGYSPAFASLLPPSGALASSLQGAFQPKVSVVANHGPVPGRLHDAGLAQKTLLPGQMLLPFRDREKPAAVPAPSVLPQPKKQGRWCAVHVRVAWEIYHHQQKQQQEAASGPGPATKPADKPGGDPLRGDPLRGDPLRGDPLKGDPLRHSNHLLPGAALPRPPDLQAAGPAALLASSHSRALEALPHHSTSFFSPGPLGLPPFPRPAPCPPSMIGLGFGGLGSLLGRDLPAPTLTSPHEWNRLHRTPPSFPVWPKPDLEREKEKEREAEREREREREQERERERDLRREEEREREQRLASQRLEERARYKDSELSQPSARPRSRSPLRNGRLDSSKSDLTGGVDRRLDEKVGSGVKVKEERREEELLQAERDKMMQNSYLGLAGHHLPPHSVGPPIGFSLLERARMVPPPHTYLPGLDPRPSMSSPAMWNPFDKTSQDINHRLELERERERERMAIMSRLSGATSITLMEQERLKEQMFREHQERELELRRQYLERLQPYERERLSYEQKMRSMEAVFASAAYSPFARTISPMFNHHASHHLPTGSKSNSPASLAPGIPPPLIPSASATVVHPPAPTGVPPRSHDSSPTSSKSKGYSPADSTSDLKDKRDSCSTDPDAHSR